MSLSTGTQLGPYEVVSLLGAGAMGEVYRARDTRLRRQVAIKVLPDGLAADPDRLRRFEQEARAAGALNHPNIVAVHDMGRSGSASYVVSELLEGDTLRERLEAGPLPVRKVLDFGMQMARGLAAAHEKGIVHRDLKPDNVFLTRDGTVKILDFGLAKLSRTPFGSFGEGETGELGSGEEATGELTDPGVVLGTIGYMAPEQVRGEDADHRADLFALGAILYEMLTGRRAFQGRSAVETLNAILKEDPPEVAEVLPEVPPAVERIVAHCLEKSPAERFQSARDLAFDLEALSHASGLSPRSGARPALVRSRKRLLGWSAAVLALLALTAAGFVYGRSRALPPPEYDRIAYRRGVVASARFAADGQVLYSASWEGAPLEVWSARPESPESRSLEHRAAVVVAATRTGDMLLLRDDPAPGSVLARASLAGGPAREIAEGVLDADATPDGGAFAVVRADKGRVRLEYPLGRTVYEAAAGLGNVRLSADGAHVAFLEHPVAGDDRGRAVVVDREGKVVARSSDYASSAGLAWAAGGREVWFTAARVGSESGLWALDLMGRERLVTRAPGRLVLHDVDADGRAILQRVAVRLEIKGHLDGQPETDLSWLDHGSPAAVSADGQRLLFYESGEGGGRDYAVFLRGLDGSPPVRLGEGRAMGLSPDGRWALAIPLDAPARLVLLPTGAGQPRVLRHPGLSAYRWAAFFPDGQRLAVVADEGGRAPRLYEVALDGAVRPRPLAPEGLLPSTHLAVSPDGRQIVAGEPAMLVPVSGGEPAPVPGLQRGEVAIGWTADGRGLYVRKAGGLEVKVEVLDLASGQRTPWRQITLGDRAGVAGMNTVLPLPAGNGYVYAYRRLLSDLYVVRGLR